MTQADSSFEETDANIRRVCAILESIAGQYLPSTSEHQAIQDAATAFIVVHQQQALTSAYRKMKAAMAGELTPEIIDNLRSMGFDPEELEIDETSCESA